MAQWLRQVYQGHGNYYVLSLSRDPGFKLQSGGTLGL